MLCHLQSFHHLLSDKIACVFSINISFAAHKNPSFAFAQRSVDSSEVRGSFSSRCVEFIISLRSFTYLTDSSTKVGGPPLSLSLSLTRNAGPRSGSRQRHHSTAVRITVTISATVTAVQESTHPAGRSALPAPRPAVTSPGPAVSGSLSSAPVSPAPESGAFRLFRRSFIRRFCKIGFGIRRSSTVFKTVRICGVNDLLLDGSLLHSFMWGRTRLDDLFRDLRRWHIDSLLDSARRFAVALVHVGPNPPRRSLPGSEALAYRQSARQYNARRFAVALVHVGPNPPRRSLPGSEALAYRQSARQYNARRFAVALVHVGPKSPRRSLQGTSTTRLMN